MDAGGDGRGKASGKEASVETRRKRREEVGDEGRGGPSPTMASMAFSEDLR